MRKLLLAGTALLVTAGSANAVTIFSGSLQSSGSVAAPAGALGPFGGSGPAPGGGGLLDIGGAVGGLLSFTLPFAGTVTVTVTDIGLLGDVYQAVVDGTQIGETSHVTLPGTFQFCSSTGVVCSSGSFTRSLAAGTHTLGIEDLLLSYEGTGKNPFGGAGTLPLDGGGYDPAAFDVLITEASVTTPEPAALAMLGAGLLGLAGVRRRRK